MIRYTILRSEEENRLDSHPSPCPMDNSPLEQSPPRKYFRFSPSIFYTTPKKRRTDGEKQTEG